MEDQPIVDAVIWTYFVRRCPDIERKGECRLREMRAFPVSGSPVGDWSLQFFDSHPHEPFSCNVFDQNEARPIIMDRAGFQVISALMSRAVLYANPKPSSTIAASRSPGIPTPAGR